MTTAVADMFAQKILGEIDRLIQQAESQTRPLEIDPYHRELFQLFKLAYEAGLTGDDASPDLSADGICKQLAALWGLTAAAQTWLTQSAQLPKAQLMRMRSLWSVMRMWMEWDFALRNIHADLSRDETSAAAEESSAAISDHADSDDSRDTPTS